MENCDIHNVLGVKYRPIFPTIPVISVNYRSCIFVILRLIVYWPTLRLF